MTGEMNSWCSSEIASSYHLRPSKVTGLVTSRISGAILKQNKSNLKKPNPNPNL